MLLALEVGLGIALGLAVIYAAIYFSVLRPSMPRRNPGGSSSAAGVDLLDSSGHAGSGGHSGASDCSADS